MAVILAMLYASSVPGVTAIGLFGAAAIVIFASHPLRKLEIKYASSATHSFLFIAAFVALPMMLVGLAVAVWSASPAGLPPQNAIALIVGLASLGMVTLQGRLPSLLTAYTSAWLGYSLLHGLETLALVSLVTVPCIYGLTLFHRRHNDARQAAENEQRRIQSRAEKLLSEYEATGQGWFWETDRHGNVSYVSPSIDALLCGQAEAFAGKPFTEMFVLDTEEKGSERTLNFHLSTRSSFQDLAVLAATDEKEDRWWSITGRPVMDSFGNFMGFRGSGTDLTETKRSQRHVTELARFDSLTKLANRFQMAEWLEKILSAPRIERRSCAVFLLDLDRFKQVNDTMGHPAGDALLVQVADRLRSTVGDKGSVGRLGGDEFQVLLPGHHANADLANLASRIIEHLSHPYSIEGHRVTIGASVGIACCPENGTTSEELIRNADLALYAAKDGGRGRHHFYAKDLHSDAEERRQLEQDLRDAIADGGFELHYQPQVATFSEKIAGFEALLRWKHPEHGYLSPDKFVPIAEDTGLIVQIGEWVLREACGKLAQWPDSVRVAVNVSPLQFANPALPATVTSAVANAGIDPGRLELEITESVFLNDDKTTEAMFNALKGIGVRLALDDFGTGYSSLGYLKKAPFDKIKIDQSFVRGATVNGSRNGAIISSIVNLAESLGMETTAEGVETLDELDLIRVLGCSHIQGYIYEKALPPEAATARLQAGLNAIAEGPKSARAPRQKVLRKVVLDHGGHRYQGTIRNISASGAMVEGLWNVPPGTVFDLHLSKDYVIKATTRWSNQDHMGVEFVQELELDENGAVSFQPPRRSPAAGSLLRKAG